MDGSRVERVMRRGDRMMRRNALDKDQKKTEYEAVASRRRRRGWDLMILRH